MRMKILILRDFEGQISSYYRAKEDGRLYVNEWYVDKRGNSLYYFIMETKERQHSGLTQVDGTLYYFLKMVVDIKMKRLP